MCRAFSAISAADRSVFCSRARAAASALDKGVWTASSGENRDYALWLLRTTESYADAVDLDGTRTYVRADMPGAGIRPALWIDTSLALLKEIGLFAAACAALLGGIRRKACFSDA